MREGSNGTKVQAFLRRAGVRRHTWLSVSGWRAAAGRRLADGGYPSILVP